MTLELSEVQANVLVAVVALEMAAHHRWLATAKDDHPNAAGMRATLAELSSIHAQLAGRVGQ